MSEPDAFLGGRLRLHQPPRGAHRAGTDGVLLARLLAPAPGEKLCDLGSGPGIVGLACTILNPGLSVTLVERDFALAELARANAALHVVGDGVAVPVVRWLAERLLTPLAEAAEATDSEAAA